MKYYLKDLLPRLKKYSAELDHATFLTDKPWVVSGEEHGPFQKLIFRKDGRVHLSNNGDLTDGKWEYLPEAKALIIDYGSSKKLFRHEFLDEAVLALKVDGRKSDSDEDYFLLSDENKVPDANAKLYLKKKYLRENRMRAISLLGCKEAYLKKPTNQNYDEGYNEISDGYAPLPDGVYLTSDGQYRYKVHNGKTWQPLKLYVYEKNINAWQQYHIPKVGDEISGLINGTFNFSIDDDKYTIEVKNSKVYKVTNESIKKRMMIFFLFVTLFFLISVILVIIYS